MTTAAVPTEATVPAPVAALPAMSRGTLPERYGDPRHWREVAERAQGQGDVDLALHAWLHLQELRPEAPEVMFHIGCCLALRQEIGRACLAFYTLADRKDAAPGLRQRAARLAALLDPDPQAVMAMA
jgi:hypothetical protein